MTRFLSESLQAGEPFFRLGLKRLEADSGHPNTDIRFSTEVQHAAQDKLRQLGLDPRDTTAEELYYVLQEKIRADDARLTKTLRTHAATHISAEGDIVDGMVHVLNNLPDSKHCFGIKPSSLKTLLKQLPPKKALKRLGYRSLESCLKHERPVSIMAAAWLCEGRQWQQRLLSSYKQLKPNDFEERRILIIQADFKRWQNLADDVVSQQKHNVLSFRELGALVFLPLPAEVPAGVVTASLGLALHELNDIRTAGTFLKLRQMRPDFGTAVRDIATDQPYLSSQFLGQPLSWQLVHRYYAGLKHRLNESLFEPYLELEDMAWHPIEQTLSMIEPSLDFWLSSAHLGVLGRLKPVSLNIVDAALNCCNQLSFEHRTVRYFQHSLWHELSLRYLRHAPVEQNMLSGLQPQLAEETAAV